jgi:hypothetical protein
MCRCREAQECARVALPANSHFGKLRPCAPNYTVFLIMHAVLYRLFVPRRNRSQNVPQEHPVTAFVYRKRKRLWERAMHMDVPVPRSTWTCESGLARECGVSELRALPANAACTARSRGFGRKGALWRGPGR